NRTSRRPRGGCEISTWRSRPTPRAARTPTTTWPATTLARAAPRRRCRTCVRVSSSGSSFCRGRGRTPTSIPFATALRSRSCSRPKLDSAMSVTLDRHSYPFTAIVGQESMKLALILNAIVPTIGGVLIRGEKGTGKSTAVRALARLLPEHDVVEGCHFGCDPTEKEALCADCRARLATAGMLPHHQRRMRVVELPINASEDRVVGTIDIEAALRTGAKKFEPGVLAEANRNILYVDEVNLLQD